MNTEDMLVNAIVVGPKHRAVIETAVAEIAKSVAEIGLTNPIAVRRMDGRPHLIAGRQRLEAHKKLKRETIRAIIFDDSDLHAKLRELDENLCRAELTPVEEAKAEHERKQVYEALHPETKVGAAPGAGRGRGKARLQGRQNGDLPKGRYTATAAKATGRSERSAQRKARRGAELSGQILDKIHRTSLDKGDELDALVDIQTMDADGPKVVAELAERAAKGEKVKAKTEAGKIKRSRRESSLAEKIGRAAETIDKALYGIILADPPWSRDTWSEAGKSRDPANHYPTMTEDQLSRLQIPAADDCILFLWSTGEHLGQAMWLIEAWGFVYKSCAVWVKPDMSTGYWFRTQHELLLVAVKGSPVAPAPGTQISSVFEAPTAEHSVKPAIIHEMIERLWPTTDKIEMFARVARPGWARWGAEAPEDEPANQTVGPSLSAAERAGPPRDDPQVDMNREP